MWASLGRHATLNLRGHRRTQRADVGLGRRLAICAAKRFAPSCAVPHPALPTRYGVGFVYAGLSASSCVSGSRAHAEAAMRSGAEGHEALSPAP
jgi:hypothetical protein